MPLRRTYASASLILDSLSESTETVQPSPVAPVPFPTTVLQPIIKLPAPSSRRRFSKYLPPRQSSLLSPRRLPPLRFPLHTDRRIIPPFKPSQNLYRKVLNRQFLGATKKSTTNNPPDPFFASLLPLSKKAASSDIKQKLSAVEANEITVDILRVAIELQTDEASMRN